MRERKTEGGKAEAYREGEGNRKERNDRQKEKQMKGKRGEGERDERDIESE